MPDENSLGPLGPNILNVESVSDTVYSVQGHNFVTGFQTVVRDGVGETFEGAIVTEPTATKFTLTLPFATSGPCTLVVTNPDGRSSTVEFSTPGTSGSNQALRADS
ncbi:MAG: hypothetical protein ACRYFU_22945 [Janthinobacterium lividum]